MKQASHRVLSLFVATTLAVGLAACTATNPSPGGGTPVSAKVAGVAAGQAVDSQGKPLGGVTVDVAGSATENAKYVSYTPQTDATGKYRQADITPGTYKANAWHELTYNGRKYFMPLWSPQGKHSEQLASKEGIVRDFVWKISGEKPGAASTDGDGAFYGATVLIYGEDFMGNPLTLPEAGTQLTVKLVPDGPLMDGTTGKELLETVAFKTTLASHIGKNNDVPVGRYTVSAQAKLADGSTKALRVSTAIATDDSAYKPTAMLEFEPGGVNIRPYQEHPTKHSAVYMKI